MKRMMIAMVLSCLSITATASGDGRESRDQERFAEHKQKVLNKLGDHTSCVQNAADIEALRACRSATMAEMERGRKNFEKRHQPQVAED